MSAAEGASGARRAAGWFWPILRALICTFIFGLFAVFALYVWSSRTWSLWLWNATGREVQMKVRFPSGCADARVGNKHFERRYPTIHEGDTARVSVNEQPVGECVVKPIGERHLYVNVYPESDGGYVVSCSEGD